MSEQQQDQQQQQQQQQQEQQQQQQQSVAAPYGMCMGCHKSPIEYETSSCHHPVFCKKCAMKCASGGYCKVCKQLYPDLRKVAMVHVSDSDIVSDDENRAHLEVVP